MTLPFCNVVPCAKYHTKYFTSNSKSATDSSCLTSPSTIVFRCSLDGSGTSDAATKTGPRGANVSNPLENPHCGTTPA